MRPIIGRVIKFSVDVLLTLFLWTSFFNGMIFIYIPVCFMSYFFSHKKENFFQRMNHYFFRAFFFIVGALTPGLKIDIAEDIYDIQSSIIISNHRSYLDPILLVSLFPKHKTIVKGVFFSAPVMGWIMKNAGYIPFVTSGKYSGMMIERIEKIKEFISDEGNLFIFPEGTRSRDGKLGTIKKGAFNIATRSGISIEVLFINNTDMLFTPGRFFFNTCIPNTITVERLGRVETRVQGKPRSVNEVRSDAMELINNRINSQVLDV